MAGEYREIIRVEVTDDRDRLASLHHRTGDTVGEQTEPQGFSFAAREVTVLQHPEQRAGATAIEVHWDETYGGGARGFGWQQAQELAVLLFGVDRDGAVVYADEAPAETESGEFGYGTERVVFHSRIVRKIGDTAVILLLTADNGDADPDEI